MKKGFKFLVSLLLAVSIVGCSGGKEITLNLSFGNRTGTYTGDEVDGVPNGEGKFVSSNDSGDKWTYEGTFVNGHFEGEGKTTWADGSYETGTYSEDVLLPVSEDEARKLFSDPASLANHKVHFIGKVFSVDYWDEGVAIQLYTDPVNYDNDLIAYIFDPDFEVKTDEYVEFTGLVSDVLEGENALGGRVSVPTVSVQEAEVVSYKDAVHPTEMEIEVDESQDQYGYKVTLEKVEFADEETRIYLRIDNSGSDTFNLYSFNAILSQNGKQFSEQSNWEADYASIDSDLLVGNYTEGIICFPAIDSDAPFTLTLDAYSNNWDEEIKPYTFKVDPGNEDA